MKRRATCALLAVLGLAVTLGFGIAMFSTSSAALADCSPTTQC
jgi:hypothetical protein